MIVDKLSAVYRSEPDLQIGELARVSAPTLLMLGEHDLVTVEHAEEMQWALPDAKLLVVPEATHGLPMEKPDVVSRAVLEFLAG